MSLIITDAGIKASIDAGVLGVNYKITHIAIGLKGYVPNADQTALKEEVVREAITRGEVVAPGQLHFETVFASDIEFEGKEVGYFLEDGTLFAVDSRDGDIMSIKRSNTIITEAFELNLANSAIENITVEIMGTQTATETVAGIAKIVTNEQVDVGDDDSAFLTVKKLKRVLNDMTDVMFPINSKIIGGANPSTRGFSGIWMALEADISIRSVIENDVKIGTVDGENDPIAVIPLTEINALFEGNLMDEVSFEYNRVDTDDRITAGMETERGVVVQSGGAWTTLKSPGTPSGIIKVDAIGTEGATNNVRGKCYYDVIWNRTA